MGSGKEASVIGEFTHPIIDEKTEEYDPWQRNYFQPPPLNRLVQRKYPLIDVRPLLANPDYKPDDLLKSHGFAIVKQHSAFLDQLNGDVADDALTRTYTPEIEKLVRETLGAKTVFVMATVLRQGKSAPEPFKFPLGIKPISQAVSNDTPKGNGEAETKPAAEVKPHKLATQSNLALAAPVRTPHMDFTPLGVRRTIRLQSQDIKDAAVQSGVIAAEDKLCEGHPFDALAEESNSAIEKHYNENGKLGPRYAAYSIWRPLKKVGRDPISLSPRREVRSADGERVYFPYVNKVPGPKELNGDYLKQYAMLGVQGEEAPKDEQVALKWYYISEHEPDEVLFIKLFDSASLGADAEHASAPWHASPEIGSVLGDNPRESFDARVLVFW